MYIDIHSHLDHPLIYKNIDVVIKNAKKANLKHIITNGIDPITNRITLELAKKYDIIKAGLGIYPRSALTKEIEDENYNIKTSYNVDKEIEFIKSNKANFVCLSEVGLDFVNGEDKQQISDFNKIIKLAEKIDKPLVIHSRKAEKKVIEILSSTKIKKIVLHCFCGKKSLVNEARDKGWYFTVPTSVVRAQQFQNLVEETPISQLFCETDSPYLSPFKDKQNEPAFVKESYKMIAKIKKLTLEEASNNIYMNYQKIFT
tara:strand:+ start:2486 stop:3259 length:774 start_codon:yes stop_codon:yes gene_type:complete